MVSMPKVSEAHRAARRDEILDAAQRVFARRGYRGSSMATIIDESGLSAGAIYGYFDGKQELFRAVVERTFAERASELEPQDGDRPRSPGELIRAVLLSLRGHPMLKMAPQIWGEAAVEPEIRTVVSTVFERLGESVRAELTAWAQAQPGRVEGDPAGWAARVAPVVISAIQGFILQRVIVSSFDEDAYLSAVTVAFCGGDTGRHSREDPTP
jgi:TetR/AcrR family transcriptional regulator, transcriptional repressor of aconitase